MTHLDGGVDDVDKPLAREVTHCTGQEEETSRQDKGVAEEQTSRDQLPASDWRIFFNDGTNEGSLALCTAVGKHFRLS